MGPPSVAKRKTPQRLRASTVAKAQIGSAASSAHTTASTPISRISAPAAPVSKSSPRSSPIANRLGNRGGSRTTKQTKNVAIGGAQATPTSRARASVGAGSTRSASAPERLDLASWIGLPSLFSDENHTHSVTSPQQPSVLPWYKKLAVGASAFASAVKNVVSGKHRSGGSASGRSRTHMGRVVKPSHQGARRAATARTFDMDIFSEDYTSSAGMAPQDRSRAIRDGASVGTSGTEATSSAGASGDQRFGYRQGKIRFFGSSGRTDSITAEDAASRSLLPNPSSAPPTSPRSIYFFAAPTKSFPRFSSSMPPHLTEFNHSALSNTLHEETMDLDRDPTLPAVYPVTPHQPRIGTARSHGGLGVWQPRGRPQDDDMEEGDEFLQRTEEDEDDMQSDDDHEIEYFDRNSEANDRDDHPSSGTADILDALNSGDICAHEMESNSVLGDREEEADDANQLGVIHGEGFSNLSNLDGDQLALLRGELAALREEVTRLKSEKSSGSLTAVRGNAARKGAVSTDQRTGTAPDESSGGAISLMKSAATAAAGLAWRTVFGGILSVKLRPSQERGSAVGSRSGRSPARRGKGALHHTGGNVSPEGLDGVVAKALEIKFRALVPVLQLAPKVEGFQLALEAGLKRRASGW
ncbi:hypothetical protein HDU93_002967 [Gonapodya sp. JEL0774]|nr:hypothetical protein HDU93_002967 [Gonapodya sp. JEL0774]